MFELWKLKYQRSKVIRLFEPLLEKAYKEKRMEALTGY